MKTQNINTPAPFFTPGTRYRCTKSVKMNKNGRETFTKGQIYEQTNEPTYFVGWLRNEQGDRHAWPQPVYIAKICEVWDMKPEDADPRNYFEPVSE